MLTSIISIILLILFGLAIYAQIELKKKQEEHERYLSRMPPEEWIPYARKRMEEEARISYGNINSHVICPHCQEKGTVRAKPEIRTITSTGKVGGILKPESVTSH